MFFACFDDSLQIFLALSPLHLLFELREVLYAPFTCTHPSGQHLNRPWKQLIFNEIIKIFLEAWFILCIRYYSYSVALEGRAVARFRAQSRRNMKNVFMEWVQNQSHYCSIML